ncbi:MAG: hypothetical protein QXX68_00905 [Candidatus Pacearchaeota archaeon]
MVTFFLDQATIDAFRRGEPLTPDLIRVLDESGDPRWIECLLRCFQNTFFKGDPISYYDFARVVDFRLNYKLYMNEQNKRFRKAYSLRSWVLGRSLTPDEELDELERNHISKDFRLYFLLEHPECCGIDKEKVQRNPHYREALEWLLFEAKEISGVDYSSIIEENTRKIREKDSSLLALAS